MANLDPEFSWTKPLEKPVHVKEAIFYGCQGPFTTKTGALLVVGASLPNHYDKSSFSIPYNYSMEDFMKISEAEEKLIKNHVKETFPGFDFSMNSFRLYFQPRMPGRKSAGNEFHRIRREIILALRGKLETRLEDLYGDERTEILEPGKALVIPPFLMHTLHAKKTSGVIVIANTTFYVRKGENKIEVRDTYSRETFKKLKSYYKSQ